MEKTFTEKLRKILNSLEVDDDGGCGDLDCCGKTFYYVSCESKDKAQKEIKELIKTIVPKEFVPRGCIENDEAGGFNDCREEILKALEE